MNINTLHMCNFDNLTNLNNYKQLITKNDAVVFYSQQMDREQYQKLKQLFDKIPVYFIIENNLQNLMTITYEYWIELVNQAEKTFTWK